MFGFGKNKLSEDRRLEVETTISLHVENHCNVSQGTNTLEMNLEAVEQLGEALKAIPEGEAAEINTLKMSRVKLIRKNGKIRVIR